LHVAKVLTTSITGIALAFSMLASTLPANAASGYHAAYFSESDFLAKAVGESGQFAVGYTNTGDQAWVKGAANQQANLGTAAPLENTTDFTAGWSNGWLSANRYTAQNAALVAPGQIGFFIYNFTVPTAASAGEHRFYGREVIDGVTYLEDYGYYQSVTVTAAPALGAAPVLTSLTPSTGSSAGGTSVTIAGTGFVCTPTLPTVNFGTTAATVTSCGSTSIVVTSPAGAVGTANVTVTNAGGTASAPLTFTYADTTAPVFASVTASGTTLTLTFSEPVCRNAAFASSDYVILINGANATATGTNAPLAAPTTNPTNCVTSFTVTSGTAFVNGDTVAVTLTSTGAAKIQDAAGNTATAQTRTATATGDTTKPSISTAAATAATTLTLTYSESVVCDNSAAAAAQFSVTPTGGSATAPTSVACTTANPGSTTVTLTFTAGTFVTGTAGTVTYTQGVSAVRVKDLSGNDAVSPQTLTYTAFTADTTRPLSQDIRMKTNAGLSATLDNGDVFTVAFNEVMAAPTTGAKIRLTDADGTVADVLCGDNSGNATCTLSVASTTIGGVAYPAGQVITVTMKADPTQVGTSAGTTAGLAIPSTVTDSTGYTDVAGNVWDIVNSPDKILN